MVPDCSFARIAARGIECSLASSLRKTSLIHSKSNCDRCRASWPNGEEPTIDKPPAWLQSDLEGRRKEPPTASPREMAKAVATAVIRYVRNGGRITPKDVQKARMQTCKGCEHMGSLLGAKTCLKCRCFLVPKTHLPDEHCPLAKWENGKAPCCNSK